MKFSDRVKRVKPSFTLEMTSRAAELHAKGVDVINFSVGEPDFNTPDHIIRAGKEAMDNGFTKYTAGSGMIELREAICEKLERDNELYYDPNQVLVSNGEKQSLFTACQVLFQQGDEVIIFSPYWVSFPEFVRLADAEPIIVKTDPNNQFEPDFDDLQLKITNKTKGVIINSPSNPTGGVWSEEAIIKILEMSAQNNWTVISDECYEQLVFDGKFVSTQKLNSYETNVLTCMSLSKTYAMTGWRIGYTTANDEIVKAMSKIQGQTTSCPNAIGQKASVAALLGDQEPVKQMKEKFRHRRTVMYNELNGIDNVHCDMPGGAFYMFPDFSHYLNKKNEEGKILQDTFDLSDYILADAKVVTVAGDGFGASKYLRFSFATNTETIIKGIKRIKKSLEKLK